jgi:hypothetical protein
MLHFTASIDKSRINVSRVLFVTLTYPESFPREPEQWKADLKAFKKRLERAFGHLGVVWKLEPQERGAPHFHLMILAPAQRVAIGHFRQWVARSWFEIAGGGDEKHLRVHLHSKTVQRCRSWNGVAHYCSKYMSKVCQFFSDEQPDPESTDSFEKIDEESGEVRVIKLVGRYWGVWRRELWPIRQCAKTCCERDWFRVRRYVRKFVEKRAKGKAFKRNRDHRAIWYGKHPRSYRGFVSGDVIDKLITWACPYYDDGISYDEIYEFERELERGRALESEFMYHV